MASFSHLPISLFAYASLLFFYTLICLGNASIEQLSSRKSSIRESLKLYHDQHVITPPSIPSDFLPVSGPKKPSIRASLKLYHDRHVITPPSIPSDFLPVSRPKKPSIRASLKPYHDQHVITPPSIPSDFLPVSDPTKLPIRTSLKLYHDRHVITPPSIPFLSVSKPIKPLIRASVISRKFND